MWRPSFQNGKVKSLIVKYEKNKKIFKSIRLWINSKKFAFNLVHVL